MHSVHTKHTRAHAAVHTSTLSEDTELCTPAYLWAYRAMHTSTDVLCTPAHTCACCYTHQQARCHAHQHTSVQTVPRTPALIHGHAAFHTCKHTVLCTPARTYAHGAMHTSANQHSFVHAAPSTQMHSSRRVHTVPCTPVHAELCKSAQSCALGAKHSSTQTCKQSLAHQLTQSCATLKSHHLHPYWCRGGRCCSHTAQRRAMSCGCWYMNIPASVSAMPR